MAVGSRRAVRRAAFQGLIKATESVSLLFLGTLVPRGSYSGFNHRIFLVSARVSLLYGEAAHKHPALAELDWYALL